MPEKQSETRERKMGEGIGLKYEHLIYEELINSPRTKEVVENPESEVLVVGDPDYTMTNLLVRGGLTKITVVEGDNGVAEKMKEKPHSSSINLINSKYPFDVHNNGYDLIILKNILFFNRDNPNFLSGAIEDLSPNGVIVISETLLYQSAVPKLLRNVGLNSERKSINFGTGSIFVASRFGMKGK